MCPCGGWLAEGGGSTDSRLSVAQVIAGKEDRLISIFQAEKQRNATIIREGANAQAKRLRLESQTRAYAVLRETVGMTQDQLLKYLWIQRLRSLPESTKLLVGFDDAVVTTS